MVTVQNLLLVENFLCRSWRKHFFPAGTPYAEVAKVVDKSVGKVRTAVRRKYDTLGPYDVYWV